MSKKKAKKHKKEKKSSATPPREDRVKRRDGQNTPGDPKDPRRKSSGHPRPSTEDSQNKETSKKSDGQKKPAVFKGHKTSQDSDRRASHHSETPYVSSSGKSSSSRTPSRPACDVSSKELEEERKRLVKRRSAPLEPKQRTPEAAFRSEKESKKPAKRRSSTDEDHPVAKTRSTEDEQGDGAVGYQRSEELSQQRKKLVERRSREVVSDEKYCRSKRESSRSKKTSSSVKNQASVVIPNATQHVSPKLTRPSPDSTHHLTSGEKPSSRPHIPVTFKIPKKSRVVKAQTNTAFWDSVHKTPAVCKKQPASVSVATGSSSTNAAPDPKKLGPSLLFSQSRKKPLPFSSSPLPQVQLAQPNPVRDRSSPSSTPTSYHVAGQRASTEHTEAHKNDQEMQLVEELHLARSDKRLQVNVVESYGELTCMDVDPPEEGTTLPLSQEQRQQDIFIVLDTNVLLSHLEFVKKIRSHGLGALGFPTLLVPWVVLQELDALKSGKLSQDVEYKARPAVHYIYSCLKNQEPRLWGQSMQQASQVSRGPGVMNNDDRVLQCCLQYQTLYPEGTLILCSNDKNLCSKALLSGVKALSKADLVVEADAKPGLLKHRYSQRAARPSAGHTTEEQERKPRKDEEEASRRKVAVAERGLAECVPVLESNLQSALSAVLEEEMKAAFGELWLEIVYLKPPWTLEAVLQCFRKHWIAVFGSIIQRNLLSCVETLSSCLCSGASVERESVLTALHVAGELLMVLSRRSQYNGHVAPALSYVQALQHRLLGQKTPAEDTSDGDTPMAEAVEDVARPPQTSHQDVWAFFESLWNNLCHVSSAVFSALHYSPGTVETVQLFSTPPPQDALACLHRLSDALRQLLEAFQRVLSVDSAIGDAQALLTVIHTTEIAAVEPQFTAKDLFECLSQREYREKLCVGGAQLMELRTNLDRCAAAVCGQSGGNT
ncbi:transcriptional protein SWT1 [Salminus brasiliensis]|uniref:transcriptional protein SWT1 n=1 Tax=Salminus brasiliensis TaxID=930266 RepID=UPI003B8373B1